MSDSEASRTCSCNVACHAGANIDVYFTFSLLSDTAGAYSKSLNGTELSSMVSTHSVHKYCLHWAIFCGFSNLFLNHCTSYTYSYSTCIVVRLQFREHNVSFAPYLSIKYIRIKSNKYITLSSPILPYHSFATH